jgi:hypothetical protein
MKGFKRGLGVKETLGLGYEEFDREFLIGLDMPIYPAQIAKMNEELEESGELKGGIFDKGFDWKLEVVGHNGYGSVKVRLEGRIERDLDFDLEELEIEVSDKICILCVVENMMNVSLDPQGFGEIVDDVDLKCVLEGWKCSLYSFDEDDKEGIEEMYVEGYVPSEELEEMMIEMMSK